MPISWVFFGLAAGIIAAHYFGSIVIAWISVSLGVLVFAWKKARKIAVFAVFLGLGFVLAVLRMDMLSQPEYGMEEYFTVKSGKLVQSTDEYCAWQGRIIEPENLAGATVLIYSQQFQPGKYTLSGALYPPVQYRNPGQGWHYLRKIYAGEIGILKFPRLVKYQPETPTLLESLRGNYRANLLDNLGDGEGAALALALTTGDRSLLDRELKSAVYLTGVGHIMALSGLHISVLAGLIIAVLRRLRFPHRLAMLVSAVFLIVYVVFVGPAPSLIRAVLMSAYGVAAVLAGREKLGLPALLWTGTVMLLFNPLWLFDYAFAFSFIATFVCLVAGRRMEKPLAFLPEPLRRVASLTLIIQLTALPLNLYLFGSFSLWAPLANIVIVPLMPALTCASFAAGLSGLAGKAAALPLILLLNGVAEFIKLLSQLPLEIKLGGIKLVMTAIGSASLLLFVSRAEKKYLALVLAVSICVMPLYTLWESHVSSVWFLDVGQGDSILIRNRGRWFLIDCGDAMAGEKAVVPALEFLGVERLDALIITHPHSDHAGGIDAVLANLPTELVYVSSCFADSQWKDNVHGFQIVRGNTPLTQDLMLYSHNISLPNLNDNSLLTSLDYRGVTLIFAGDLEEEGEKLYYSRLKPAQVVKIAHHGSKTSTSTEFLAKVRPRTAVISCGLGNRFGFPDEGTLDKLHQSGAHTYRTDISGCVHTLIWPWQAYSIFSFSGR